MRELQKLTTNYLTNLEFGQYLKTMMGNLDALPAGTITDPVITHYTNTIKANNVEYDKAMVFVAKSDETEKIMQADFLRDNAITAFTRQLHVYEVSEITPKVLAYKSLRTLMDAYDGIQKWNYEKETNGMANLLNELLNTPKYVAHIATLNMAEHVALMNERNTDFKTLYDNRSMEEIGTVVYDVKKMRSEYLIVCTNFIDYVIAMCKVPNSNVQYDKVLEVINIVRNSYYLLVARRNGGDDTPPAPTE